VKVGRPYAGALTKTRKRLLCVTSEHKIADCVMNAYSPTISIRLPEKDRASLELATKLTRRSRSFLVKEALERHLADILREQRAEVPNRRLTHLLSIGGAGVSKEHVRSREEIDAHIRWLRDNE
jgi:predicted DNA-binding protein